MPLNGEQLEQLADLVMRYNGALLRGKEQDALKQEARDGVLALMKAGGEHEVTVVGNKVAIAAVTTRTIKYEHAEHVLKDFLRDRWQEALAAMTTEKTDLRLSIRPIRTDGVAR